MRFLKTVSLAVILLLSFSMAVFAQQGATLGGYGELHYNDVTYKANGQQPPGKLDFHRFILYAGYDFNDWVKFRSELEVEHTYVEEGQGEIALEQAYIDLAFKKSFGARGGIMLVPMGIVNPVHEPPTFNGVERPNVEKYIIPSTWREAGAGIYGKTESGLSYKLYLMAGLDTEGISGSSGIRGARQKAYKASTDNWAVTGRLDYRPNLNLTFGASYFFSQLSSNYTYGSAMDGAAIHMIDGHAIYNNAGFEARGLFVYSAVSNADDINTTLGSGVWAPSHQPIGDTQYGGYVELSYDLLRFKEEPTEQQLNLFGRAEVYDTQASTVNVVDNPENERYEYTFGLTYKPVSQVAVKADYQLLTTQGGFNDKHQLNIGVGYNF
ncbi:hypothetical protein LX73_0998 [Fodinibius salinus]|uniref:Porin n=1 Tax=Fodinibius salinus TaxID=860790 RepID=A0A5D3YIH6_9BACT|nr:DUF3373 domain-containing protein [Fodinibius salinus]TYP93298.1 hypothetical protein LX73_0998 [Fodinibius salinus]